MCGILKKDIKRWCKECHSCQAAKVHRHTEAPISLRNPLSGRFLSLLVDLVGPLPPSEGMTYLFTVIDRFTRWTEAIPLPDAKASTCVKALIRHWISRFDIPADITSDRGAQFTSSLWAELGTTLGIHMQRTTAHPQANGMSNDCTDNLKVHSKHELRIHTGWIIFQWSSSEFIQRGAKILTAPRLNWSMVLPFASHVNLWSPHLWNLNLL